MLTTPPDTLSTPAHNAPHAAEARRRDLAHIHIAIKQLAMADADYRAIVTRISRGRSSSAADLTAHERRKLLSTLRALGYRPRQSATTNNRPSTPLARKARALWIQAAQQGVVRNPSEQALAAFAQSAVGVRWAGTVPNAQAAAVVEAIKAMLARIAPKNPQTDLNAL